jgi:uncharacterized coiled-coil DUF342 family protein
MEVVKASRSWPVHFGKQQQGHASQVSIGIFQCPQCKSKFRSKIKPDMRQTCASSVRELVDRVVCIRDGLLLNLSTLREKINTLEMERSALLAEAEELRKVAQSRADALENEVSQLRQEIKALKELLDSTGTE